MFPAGHCRITVLDVAWLGAAGWSFARPLLHPETADKVALLSRDDSRKWLRTMDASDVPVFLGGKDSELSTRFESCYTNGGFARSGASKKKVFPNPQEGKPAPSPKKGTGKAPSEDSDEHEVEVETPMFGCLSCLNGERRTEKEKQRIKVTRPGAVRRKVLGQDEDAAADSSPSAAAGVGAADAGSRSLPAIGMSESTLFFASMFLIVLGLLQTLGVVSAAVYTAALLLALGAVSAIIVSKVWARSRSHTEQGVSSLK